MSYLAIVKDVDGMPRAWGHASREVDARAEAERQWAARVAQRRRDGTLDRSEERGETTCEELPREAAEAETRIEKVAKKVGPIGFPAASLRVWTCEDFEGVQPTGTAAVVVAKTKRAARKLLAPLLPQTPRNLAGDWTVVELDQTIPGARVLSDGDY